MAVIDLDRYESTAAWLEYCDGMTRFQAETEAARRQGYKRHEVQHEISKRNTQGGRDSRTADARQSADNLPGVQPHATEEIRSLPIGIILAGWGGLELLALLVDRGRLV